MGQPEDRVVWEGQGVIPVRIHEINTLGGCEVQTYTARFETDQKDLARGIVLESLHGTGSFITLHSPVESFVVDVRRFQRLLDPMERCSDE